MKIRNTFITLLSVALIASMLFTFSACNKAGGLYSEKNAYVSVYIYTNPAANAKPKISLDKLRVAPDEEVYLGENVSVINGGDRRMLFVRDVEASTEIVTDISLTDDEARQIYRMKPTGLYALELAIKEKDKKASAPEVIISQYDDGTIEYTLDTVLGVSAGKSATSNDVFEWHFYINGKEADPVNAELHNYDLLEFKLKEQTYRTFSATFQANNGPKTLFENEKYSFMGEKADMTISYFLQGTFVREIDGKKVEDLISNWMGITLSEDGKRIVSVKGVAEDETHKWVVYILEEEVEGNISEIMIDEKHEIVFEYVKVEAPAETGEITGEITGEAQ